MKNIPMIVLLIMPWFIAISSGTLSVFGYAPFIIEGIIILGCMIYAFFLPRLGYDGPQIMFWNMVMKLCNIPIFLCLYAMGGIMYLFLGTEAGLLVVGIGYLLLLTSSVYGISGLICSYKAGLISRGKFIVHIISHFLFFIDVLSSTYCFRLINRNSKRVEEETVT